MSREITYTFNPEMLIIGREIRGLTQEELAKEVGISAKLQAAIEAGTFQPGHLMVDKYSEALSYPIAFFYSEGKRHPKEGWQLVCKHGGAS